jgi:hypothetical protein
MIYLRIQFHPTLFSVSFLIATTTDSYIYIYIYIYCDTLAEVAMLQCHIQQKLS